MKRVLSALSFPLLILAALLFWRGYQSSRGNAPAMPPWQLYLHYAAAGISLVLAMVGTRLRHERWRGDRPGRDEP